MDTVTRQPAASAAGTAAQCCQSFKRSSRDPEPTSIGTQQERVLLLEEKTESGLTSISCQAEQLQYASKAESSWKETSRQLKHGSLSSHLPIMKPS